jgi:DNA-binding transcriptional regulator/RsmH inhibitor MraZ
MEIDPKYGRIPIPAAIRAYAKLRGECWVLSINGHLEIWDTETYTAFELEMQAIAKDGSLNYFPEEEDD